MRNLNRLVYESSAANRYATFFYAEFDPSTRILNYVNGGHNPPMLFRGSGNGRGVVRLDTGGPVVGLVPDCTYMQGKLMLNQGDLLVAYTDGLSEAMNAADEEWGEEALMQTVQSNDSVPANTLITHLMEAADAFAAGAPQHDDMTTVVVRVV
jgi:sigma-B regulation protein RsbU (phosphoserine phosphatase)